MSVPEAKYNKKHPAPSGMASISQLPPKHSPPKLCAIPGHSFCKDISTVSKLIQCNSAGKAKTL